MTDKSQQEQAVLPQAQNRQPGSEAEMTPPPVYIKPDYRAAGKPSGKVALITGGDSGIGRAVAVHFAREGADVATVYLEEHQDAHKTRQLVEDAGRKALLIAGDVGSADFCHRAVEQTVSQPGRLDILVNNAAEQRLQERVQDISEQQLEKTFRINIFGYFFMAQVAIPHLEEGATIINTASVIQYQGSASLVDYSSTKGAIVAFTRSLSEQLIKQGIRVNGVAPGPVSPPRRRPALSFWPRTTPATSAVRCCTPTAVRSSMAKESEV